MTQEHPFSRIARLVYDSTGEGARALHRAAKATMAPKPLFSCPQVSARRVKPSPPASDSQEFAPLPATRSARIASSASACLTSPPSTPRPPPPPAASPPPPAWPSPPASHHLRHGGHHDRHRRRYSSLPISSLPPHRSPRPRRSRIAPATHSKNVISNRPNLPFPFRKGRWFRIAHVRVRL